MLLNNLILIVFPSVEPLISDRGSTVRKDGPYKARLSVTIC